jgi:UDP-N-acetylglucosamine/UDP-N-acetylgalactosamine diphosphorylase
MKLLGQIMERIIGTLKKKEHIELVKKIFSSKQEHVLEFWHELDEIKRENHLDRLSKVDFELLARLIKENVETTSTDKKGREISPPKVIGLPKTKEEKEQYQKAKELGEEALRKGEVAVFVVAGGQGSRLGYEGPKGMFQISPVKHKTLFQLFADKIMAMNLKYDVVLPWFIMTSDENDLATKEYFHEQNYFGLGKENIFIFQQGMIPAIDTSGKLVLKDKHELFMNPNGHGGSILALQMSGATAEMKKRGIKYIFYYQVDNPLVIIADPVFIGYHILNNADMSSKVLPKTCPEERVGVYGYINGRMGVIEYSDLTKEEMYAKKSEGDLLYNAGNIAIHVLSVDFVEKLNQGGLRLPYHVARKKITSHKGEIDGIKFETFVFDAFAQAERYAIVEVRREDNFAPVKNKEGFDSPATAQEMMINQAAEWLKAAGVDVPMRAGKPDGKIEISPLFALDKQEFVSKCSKNKDKLKLLHGFEVYLG